MKLSPGCAGFARILRRTIRCSATAIPGVDVFLGAARFNGRKSVTVGDQTLAARRFLIATGARAELPSIPGLRDCGALTNDSFFDLTERPQRLAILGAGPVGCELAQGMARLGVEVHLFEMAGRVLPGAIEAASASLEAALRSDGVVLHIGSQVSRIRAEAGPLKVQAGDVSVAADRLLVAAGRRANVEGLNLKAAGVEMQDGRIAVDDRLRTSNRRIFAAGDVSSRLAFTHNADAQARVVVQNALFAPTAGTRALAVPQCTYTDPEVAQVGRTQAQLGEARRGIRLLPAEFRRAGPWPGRRRQRRLC